MGKGYLHLYYGDGKGKTTAAMGLALRAIAAGKKVVIVQFMKGGRSGEIEMLSSLGARIYRGKGTQKFFSQMDEEERRSCCELQNENLISAMGEDADMLILDEAGTAWELKTVSHELMKEAVLDRPEAQECILTAHDPAQWMLDAADYCTEMHCIRHPYTKGITAREGIEF